MQKNNLIAFYYTNNSDLVNKNIDCFVTKKEIFDFYGFHWDNMSENEKIEIINSY